MSLFSSLANMRNLGALDRAGASFDYNSPYRNQTLDQIAQNRPEKGWANSPNVYGLTHQPNVRKAMGRNEGVGPQNAGAHPWEIMLQKGLDPADPKSLLQMAQFASDPKNRGVLRADYRSLGPRNLSGYMATAPQEMWDRYAASRYTYDNGLRPGTGDLRSNYNHKNQSDLWYEGLGYDPVPSAGFGQAAVQPEVKTLEDVEKYAPPTGGGYHSF